MSRKINELHDQIVGLQSDLEVAERALHAATNTVAGAPGDGAARTHARTCASRVADLRGDLGVLHNAKALAEEEDRSEAVKQRKQTALAALKQAKALAAKRITAGKAVDAALVALKSAMGSWGAINQEMGDTIISFYRHAMPAHPRLHDTYFGIHSELVNIAGNAIACQFEEAVRGLNISRHTLFQFVRAHPDIPELVERDAKKWGDKILARLDHVANAEGLQS